jgi:hypothetical protein
VLIFHPIAGKLRELKAEGKDEHLNAKNFDWLSPKVCPIVHCPFCICAADQASHSSQVIDQWNGYSADAEIKSELPRTLVQRYNQLATSEDDKLDPEVLIYLDALPENPTDQQRGMLKTRAAEYNEGGWQRQRDIAAAWVKTYNDLKARVHEREAKHYRAIARGEEKPLEFDGV